MILYAFTKSGTAGGSSGWPWSDSCEGQAQGFSQPFEYSGADHTARSCIWLDTLHYPVIIFIGAVSLVTECSAPGAIHFVPRR
jgi:hypothetical protein